MKVDRGLEVLDVAVVKTSPVAAVVVFLASQKASLVTGACVTVDGCQSRSLI